MDQKSARFIFLGLLIGGVLGLLFGAGADNIVLGVALGALAGVFIGWFVAAAMQRQHKSDHDD